MTLSVGGGGLWLSVGAGVVVICWGEGFCGYLCGGGFVVICGGAGAGVVYLKNINGITLFSRVNFSNCSYH